MTVEVYDDYERRTYAAHDYDVDLRTPPALAVHYHGALGTPECTNDLAEPETGRIQPRLQPHALGPAGQLFRLAVYAEPISAVTRELTVREVRPTIN